jgi:hypothetical protein
MKILLILAVLVFFLDRYLYWEQERSTEPSCSDYLEAEYGKHFYYKGKRFDYTPIEDLISDRSIDA